jgi:hypothetical protein
VGQRVKGQEATIIVTRGGVLETSLDKFLNFNAEFESEVKSVGYLGEKTNRKDDIFNGVKFDGELHTDKQDWLRFLVAVHDRQKRNTPNLVINVTAVLEYPGGDDPQIYFPDAKFGATPVDIGSRGDYVKKKLQGECDDYNLQLT